MSLSLEEMVGRKSDQYVAERKKVEELRAMIREILAVMDNGERTPEEMLLLERAQNLISKPKS